MNTSHVTRQRTVPDLLLVDVDTERGPSSPRLTFRGEIDGSNAERLREAVVDVLRRQRPRSIELDFSGVTFLDSAGIRTLVYCRADAGLTDCRFTLDRPQTAVYRVLEISGLLEHLGVTEPQR